MDNLQQDLKDVMEEKSFSLTAVGKHLGISTATLSQWLGGIYPGNVAKIDDAVRSFLGLERERSQASKKTIDFVMTSIAMTVFEISRICHVDGDIGVCYGDSGLGKTVAIKEYARRNNDVILIEADLGFMSKVLFSEIHKRLGMDGKGSIHDMFEEVIARLKGSGRLIIIDEAEHLPYKALELLRRVYDKAGVGILLIGMPRLLFNLRGQKGDFIQLYSRVGIAKKLERLKDQDAQDIVSSVLPSSNGTWKSFQEHSHGNTRVLSKLLLRSIRIAEINNVQVTPDIIRETASMLII